MKKHSEIGITYPRMSRDLYPTSHPFCLVCGMRRWNKIGRRTEDCHYSGFIDGTHYFVFDDYWDCHMWASRCSRTCEYTYYETSGPWHGKQVQQLPGKEAGIGNNAAYWKGDEWGYYDYSCDRWATHYPSTWGNGRGTTISYELCYQWGGTLYLDGDSSF